MSWNSSKFNSALSERCFCFSESVVLFLKPLRFYGLFQRMITQFVDSATSMGANITESKYSDTKKEFKRYYEIALKSGNEARYWLRLLSSTHDTVDKQKSNLILRELNELTAIIAKSIKTMKKNL